MFCTMRHDDKYSPCKFVLSDEMLDVAKTFRVDQTFGLIAPVVFGYIAGNNNITAVHMLLWCLIPFPAPRQCEAE